MLIALLIAALIVAVVVCALVDAHRAPVSHLDEQLAAADAAAADHHRPARAAA